MIEAARLEALLGYLNFAEGRPDPRFQKHWNDLYAGIAEGGSREPWREMLRVLVQSLAGLKAAGRAAFQDTAQAEAVVGLAFDGVMPAYREHHADLLAHLRDSDLYLPMFLVRVVESVLQQRGPWDEKERIVRGALKQLNDYVGHRPIAVLENRRKGAVYDHERVRPVPLFLQGAGVGWGPFQTLVDKTLEILQAADSDLLREACYDPAQLEEFALDPRAYDFHHPADKRPNYPFGEWDPEHIDSKGYYSRFVVRAITLEGLMQRVNHPGSLDPQELLFEAAAVLAGTVLMGAGTSGWGPATHDSTVTLTTLVPRIARYRERFYDLLMAKIGGRHAQRLAAEAKIVHQPFGGARQHLNQFLGRHRALQLQRRQVALLLAEVGYPAAARRQVDAIPVPSTRLLTEMHIDLATGRMLVDMGRFDDASQNLFHAQTLLHRAIQCGAAVDPWNILGFQGQYPRFQSVEDSIQDHRIDEMVRVVDGTLELYARLLAEGAARDRADAQAELAKGMRSFATWWDQFATTSVADIPHVHGSEAAESAEHVALALAQWRQRGESVSDLIFWKQHLDRFRSPKAFALVVDALLEKRDFRAALALLVTWIAHADEVPLEEGDHSFHELALRFILSLCPARGEANPPGSLEHARKFFDYLEANAEEYWEVPSLDPAGIGGIAAKAESKPTDDSAGDVEEQDEGDIFRAAYEDVTYKDSTDDDVEGSVMDDGPATSKDAELSAETDRLEKRLRFLSTLARLWNIATRLIRPAAGPDRKAAQDAGRLWLGRARENMLGLLELMDTIQRHEIPRPSGSYDSLVEYDQRRVTKERLLGLVINACLDQSLCVGALLGSLEGAVANHGLERPAWEAAVLKLEKALMRQSNDQARKTLKHFQDRFRTEPLLYTPLNQGGDPRKILRASVAQTVLRGLVDNLPRQGMLRETYQLVRMARDIEASQMLSGPRITEFDQLFQVAMHALVDAVAEAGKRDQVEAGQIVAVLEKMAEPFSALWVDHSKTLRVSMVEAISSDKEWEKLRKFIRNYGHDIFSARFMALANLRGILHRGVGAWLDYLEQDGDAELKLLEDLGNKQPRAEAERHLQFILQAVIENYDHYRDYNATTTQSDFGQNLYQFFDFLTLKGSYERAAWQMKPLGLVHEMLAKVHPTAAALWRSRVEGLTRQPAKEHLDQLATLQRKHGMRMATIADRLEERFVKPMNLDQLCALVPQSLEQAKDWLDRDEASPLEKELEPWASTPSGVGLDVPAWIERLQNELDQARTAKTALAHLAENLFQVPKRVIAFHDLADQVKNLT
ncbi:MAG: hypothetical protein U0744_03630 [Gemmataceae bacterium]